MLLLIAFVLFILLVAAWIAAPTAPAARRVDGPAPAGLPAMGSHPA
jgi:hypothetical protein